VIAGERKSHPAVADIDLFSLVTFANPLRDALFRCVICLILPSAELFGRRSTLISMWISKPIIRDEQHRTNYERRRAAEQLLAGGAGQHQQ
jgi:hypothetical protein